jgi:hypothetical protein
MDTAPLSALGLVLLGLLLSCASTLGLHIVYRRELRRYEQHLGNTYSERFERQAVVARSLHANLERTIQRSKLAVDQVRGCSPDGPKIRAALNQVSEWLEGAAGDSDRALKALEGTTAPAPEDAYIARETHTGIAAKSSHAS